MRVYKVAHTSGLQAVVTGAVTTLEAGVLHFGSHAEARRWCNERIREALARWKQYDNVTRLADVQWGEEIEIAAVETVSVTKAVLVRLLNTGAGPRRSHSRDRAVDPPRQVAAGATRRR